MQDWKDLIFSEETSFTEKVCEVFEYQFENNNVYKSYCTALQNVTGGSSSKIEKDGKAGQPGSVKEKILAGARQSVDNIPLFPIRGFKDVRLTCRPDSEPDLVFKSSGTSGMDRSVHPLADAGLYRESLIKGFAHFYDPEQSSILAYTPGYSENPDSSLICMLQELIGRDPSGKSRFLPLDEPLKQKVVDEFRASGRRIILFGAAFGLVDLVEISRVRLPKDSIVIETGGMKTHKREMKRMAMHKILSDGFGIAIDRVHSEYGMAELLSQAYATGGKWFRTVPWMKASVRDPDDPRQTLLPYQEGLLGIIDLANVHSCSFVLTGDKGMMDDEGRFQVLGRWNPKDLRGCNFLIDED
jgi:hypothetical protein